MMIRFKNKMTAAIISMIEKGKAHGGLPSCIEMSVEEAQCIVDEVNSLRGVVDTQHNRYKFVRGSVDARLSFTSKELTPDERFQLLADWTEQLLSVTFDGIPLKIVIVEAEAGHVY